MIDWEDRTDEGREMVLRYVQGRDPWDVARRNVQLTSGLVLSVALNVAQAAVLAAGVWNWLR